MQNASLLLDIAFPTHKAQTKLIPLIRKTLNQAFLAAIILIKEDGVKCSFMKRVLTLHVSNVGITIPPFDMKLNTIISVQNNNTKDVQLSLYILPYFCMISQLLEKRFVAQLNAQVIFYIYYSRSSNLHP